MGIPKFYRWLSERYPLVNQPVLGTHVPEVDALYLDMNGIIHNCTHGNDPSSKITETEMILRIFQYLDKLFSIVQPQKLLFMAVDGVAPRAKMNQQRSRRFKAAKERLELEAEAREQAARDSLRGETLAGASGSETSFDSNCITPGTPFMGRLAAHLRFFVRRKMADDPAWCKPRIVLSGHDVPGEGEHKIMEAIRWARRRPGYQPNQRHCMYGLDADLIMLALVTHEPNFCLLREVVKFGGGGKGQPSREALDNPSAEHFVLFQVGLLRDYFDAEFRHLAPRLPFGYDPERVVDDFVLFCMLIGNDFLPALPTLDINEGALDTVFKLYKELLPTLGGYMTRDGALDRGRLAVLLGKLGEMEGATLQARARDAEEYASKQQGRDGRGGGRGGGGGGGGGGFGNGVPQPRGPRPPPPPKPKRDPLAAAAAAIPKLLTPAALKAAMAGGRFAALAAPEGEGEGEEKAPAAAPSAAAAAADDEGEDAAPTPLEVEVVALALSKEAGAHDLEVMAALEGEPLEGEAGDEDGGAKKQEPTMMSAEARALFESGDAEAGLAAWTERYWRSKLGASTPAQRRAVADAFLAGVTWVLEYYYRGVASWTWFYAHHYAPTAAELAAAALAASRSRSRPAFERGEPFRPYQQLLAVLPAASAAHLPAPFRPLMLEAASPIADFYPEDFDVDLEGKRAEWEGVVLIPFVDERRLLEAAAQVPEKALSAHERALNRPGEVLMWSAIEADAGGGQEGATAAAANGAAASAAAAAAGDTTSDLDSTVPSALSSVLSCNSRLVRMPPPPPIPDGEPGFTHEPPGGPKARGAPPAAGFPTLRGLPADARLRAVQANVLGMPSKRESVVLKPRAIAGEEAAAIAEEEAGGRGAAMRRGGGGGGGGGGWGGGGGGGGANGGGSTSDENVSAATMAVARAAIGTRCWIHWPYLVEARVVAVSDGFVRVEAGAPAAAPAAAAAAATGNSSGAAAAPAPAPSFAVRQLDELSARAWAEDASKLKQELLTRRGVDVSLDLGEPFGRDHAPRTLLHARPAEGLVRLLDGTVEKRWAQAEVRVPPSLVLRRNPAPDPRLDAKAAAAAMHAMGWRPGARALFLGRAYYGCLAVVLPPAPEGSLRPAGAPPPAPGTLRVALSPPGAAAATAGAAAKRVLQSVGAAAHSPAFQVSRRLGISPRALGRVTGPLFVTVRSSSSAGGGGGGRGGGGGERVDVGLCVKHGGRKLCVPDYVCPAPDDRGWLYSPALVAVLTAYRSKHPWVFAIAEIDDGGPGGDKRAADAKADLLIPGGDDNAKAESVAAAAKWLKAQPLSRRPLVSSEAKVAPEAAIRALQALLPAVSAREAAAAAAAAGGEAVIVPEIELENVAPTMLLPPAARGGVSAALAGGSFDLGDRVVSIKAGGGGAGGADGGGGSGLPGAAPPFGSRGTVVGVHAAAGAIEVLFDAPFVGGNDLAGRAAGGACVGAVMCPEHLLNLSKPAAVAAPGNAAPRVVKRAAPAWGVGGSAGGAAVVGGDSASSSSASASASSAPSIIKKSSSSSTAPLAMPSAPPEAGAKGFASMGRGRGSPGGGGGGGGGERRAPGKPRGGGGKEAAAAAAAPSSSSSSSSSLAAEVAARVAGPPPPAAGASLLAQLRGPSPQKAAAQQRPGSAERGAALLSQLRGSSTAAAAAAPPPPPAASGASLLSKLRGAATPAAAPVAAPPRAPEAASLPSPAGMLAGGKRKPMPRPPPPLPQQQQQQQQPQQQQRRPPAPPAPAAVAPKPPAAAPPAAAPKVPVKKPRGLDALWAKLGGGGGGSKSKASTEAEAEGAAAEAKAATAAAEAPAAPAAPAPAAAAAPAASSQEKDGSSEADFWDALKGGKK